MYDGDIILVLEGVDNFHDEDSKSESALKFWLPKFFPKRVRVILTASPNSKSKEYLKSLGCTIMNLSSDKRMVRRLLEEQTLDPEKRGLGGQRHFERLKEVIEKQLDDKGKVSLMFAKCLLSLFSPKIDDFCINRERESISNIVTRVEYTKLESSKA